MNEFKDINENIDLLIKSNAYLIISIGDYYVQFSNDLDNEQLYFEAVSNAFLPSVGDKNKEFKQLGFKYEPNENYYKFIPYSEFSIVKIVEEIKTIFETIYGVYFSSYKIEIDHY